MIEHINAIAAGWWSWTFPMLWQTGLLAGFVWALDLLLRRRGWPQVRYALWLLVFARLLVPPSFALPTSLSARLIAASAPKTSTMQLIAPPVVESVVAPMESAPVAALRTTVEAVEPAPIAYAPMTPALSWKAWAMLASAGVSALLLVWLAAKLLRLRRIATRDAQRRPVPAWIEDMLARLAAQFHLRRLPRIAVTAEVPSAAVCGVMRPTLFLPESSLALPPEHMEHVLLHELAHLKRRDLPVNAAQSLLHILYWFNPALWFAGRQLRHLREICCDATVGNFLRERTGEYSQTLMELADRALNSKVGPALGLLGLFESPSRLRQRIEYLRRPSWKHRRLHVIVAAAAAAAMMLCVVPMAAVKADSAAAKENMPKATYQDMLKLHPDTDNVRMPTPEEMKVLGALWPQVPLEENAAYYFLRAAYAVAPNEAIPPGSASLAEKPYAGDVAAFQKWVELNQPAFKLMQQGFAQKTCCLPMLFLRENNQPTPDLSSLARMRHLARTCADAGFLAELQERPNAAVEAYADCLRLGIALRQRVVIIQELVGIALTQIGQKNMDALVATGGLDDAILRKVISESREAEARAGEPATWWATENAYGQALMTLKEQEEPQRSLVHDQWRKQRAELSQIFEKRTLPELLERATATAREIADIGKKDPGAVPDNTIFAVIKVLGELGRLDVRLRVTEIRAAIALYQNRHGGALPESLDALCPDILPAVPIDPFSGKPMRYAKTPQGWKLWSVGEDNTDNGGQGDPDPSKVWIGPDYVFISNIPSNLEWRSRPKPAPAPAAAGSPATTDNAIPTNPVQADKVKAELMGRVEDFFAHNYRDITARKTIEWGDVTTDDKGNRSIRYKYLATIWDKEKMISNEVYTFDAQGKFVGVKKVEGFPQKYAPEPADTSTQAGLIKLVEKFFSQNFRDITARETIEWGPREALPNGNLSIRYKYNATIWNKDHQVMNQVFVFDSKGELVSWKNVEGFPQPLK